MYHEAWTPKLAEELAEPFPAACHKTKRQGGSEITFVDVHRYKERLNALVGPHGWSATLRLEPIGGKLVATVALAILGVAKENVGDEVEVPELNERGNEKIIGGPATNSYAQAFKRACSDFGLGAYLYDEAKRAAATGGNGGRASTPPRQPSGPIAAPARPLVATDEEITALDRLCADLAKRELSARQEKAVGKARGLLVEDEPDRGRVVAALEHLRGIAIDTVDAPADAESAGLPFGP